MTDSAIPALRVEPALAAEVQPRLTSTEYDPRLVPAHHVRELGKSDLPLNDALPVIEVDADSFAVHIDGDEVEPSPAESLPMAQRYFLF